MEPSGFSQSTKTYGTGSLISSAAQFSPVGLRNIGNTCFMNSILQPLMATTALTEYFFKRFKSEKFRSAPLSEAYCSLLQDCAGSSSAVTPHDVKRAISRTVSQFSGYEQHDAQELMRFLLDRMHDELNRVTKKPAYKELNLSKLPVG
jgi:ubiquitin C-terminal hydrolase